MTHLDSLNLRLSNERIRLNDAKSDGERQLRQVWIAQIEREIKAEEAFIGATTDINDLFAELSGN